MQVLLSNGKIYTLLTPKFCRDGIRSTYITHNNEVCFNGFFPIVDRGVPYIVEYLFGE
jgi:hypothetical protein